MKLTTVTNVSLDGVTQGHREIAIGSGHDSGGFERFGWSPPLLDDVAPTFIAETFQCADAFLFGRRIQVGIGPELPHDDGPGTNS
jgi:hypothetical protein